MGKLSLLEPSGQSVKPGAGKMLAIQWRGSTTTSSKRNLYLLEYMTPTYYRKWKEKERNMKGKGKEEVRKEEERKRKRKEKGKEKERKRKVKGKFEPYLIKYIYINVCVCIVYINICIYIYIFMHICFYVFDLVQASKMAHHRRNGFSIVFFSFIMMDPMNIIVPSLAPQVVPWWRLWPLRFFE